MNKFDELTKGMAQSVTRRGALKQFGVGVAGMALACFGMANKAEARRVKPRVCATDGDCFSGEICCENVCVAFIPGWCDSTANPCCCHCVRFRGRKYMATGLPVCHPAYGNCVSACSGWDPDIFCS